MQTEDFGSFSEEPVAATPAAPVVAMNEEIAIAGANSIGAVSWEAVLSHVTSGILVVDGGGVVIFENAAARGILCGTSLLGANVLQGLPRWPLLNAERRPIQQHERPVVRAVMHGEEVQAEDIIIPISDDNDVVVQVSALPVDMGGAKRGAVLTLVDVTRERHALQQQAALNRSKDEFLAILSHELRTPLTPIMGWATLMRQVGGGSPEMLDQALAAIERNAELLKRLVSDLLDTTRITARKLHTEKNWCDLNEIAQAAAQSIKEQAVQNGVHLECSFGPNLPSLPLDRDRIQQVLMNLLANAAKFSAPGGTIDLRTRCEHRDEHQNVAPPSETSPSSTQSRSPKNHRFPDEVGASSLAGVSTIAGCRCVVIEVEDQGVGIAPELLPHIFDMFRQGDSSHTRRHGGLGLGLAISKSLVEMHGGTLTAHSSGVGQGALFIVTLPA